jgi:hypothetical protein
MVCHPYDCVETGVPRQRGRSKAYCGAGRSATEWVIADPVMNGGVH